MSGHGASATSAAWRSGVVRQKLTVAGLAARLEHRLHAPEVDDDAIRRGCAYAVEVGMPVVLCRPEHVEVAAQATAGTPVQVGTALAFHQLPATPPRSADSYAEEAATYVSWGASDIGLIADADDVSTRGLDGFASRVAAVRSTVLPAGGKVRVLLNTTGMSLPDLRVTCEQLAGAGAWLVQGGTFLGERVGLPEIVEMREALGPKVLLKWTNPLRSVESILVCLAEGVDRFNGNPPALLRAARVATRYEPIDIPLKGVDY